MRDLPARQVTEAGANHDEREIDAVVEVLRTTMLDIGERVERFERFECAMDRSLSLPTHQSLTSDDVGYLVEVVDEVFSSANL